MKQTVVDALRSFVGADLGAICLQVAQDDSLEHEEKIADLAANLGVLWSDYTEQLERVYGLRRGSIEHEPGFWSIASELLSDS